MDTEPDRAAPSGNAPAETYFDPLAISDRLGAHAPKYDQLAVELAEKRWAWLTEDDGYRKAFHHYLQNILAEYLVEHGESVEYDGGGWMGELAFAVFSSSLEGERCPELKARARAHAAGEVTRWRRAAITCTSVHHRLRPPLPPSLPPDPDPGATGSPCRSHARTPVPSPDPKSTYSLSPRTPVHSGQGFTREWLYDVILEQMVYVLQVHGPDAPPGAQVEEGEEGEAEAAEESEESEDEEAEEAEGDDEA